MGCVLLSISGRVQGVNYRAWAINLALGFKIDGWVRNRKGGTVEVLISGKTEAVQSMIQLCYEGPESAKVEEIHFQAAEKPLFSGFRQLPTI